MQSENYLSEFGEYIKKRLSHYQITSSTENGLLVIQVNAADLYNIISFLQHDTYCQFERLENLFSFKKGRDAGKLALHYILNNMEKKISVMVKVTVTQSVRSITEIYKSAHWLEREIWEKHQVLFEGHKDLRRLFLENES